MTENQEKELFKTLATLVTGVNAIQNDVREIRAILNDHSHSLTRLEAKTDSVAETVIDHEQRITKIEKENETLRDRIH